MSFLHRTWAEIDTCALVHNFEIIKSAAKDAFIFAVVKANAYGHSADDISLALEKCNVDGFAVSNIEEALCVRNCGITKPILILGYTPSVMARELADNNISQCVYSSEYAKELSTHAKENNVIVNIHIKLDTGMGRLGFNCVNENFEGLCDAISSAKLENLNFEGIFTHFADSDRTPVLDDGFTDLQFNLFESAVESFKKSGLNPKYCHCCNSAAICLDKSKHLNAVRPGIILYGLTPNADLKLNEDFIPVMTLKSVVSMVKDVKCGYTANYGRTFKAKKDMKIATVSAGYADGVPRLLSNRGFVLINGKKANIVGRVCMDQLCVDVSDIENVKMGDEVILFGKELPVETVAKYADTINYEIVCGISPRVPRIIKTGKG